MEGTPFAADVEIAHTPGRESLNLVIPWSDARYHFTSKQACMPASGEFRLGERTHRLGSDSTAWLDFARGVWPYSSGWNWAMCSSRRSGRSLGFNLGSGWTDGTGVNENAVYIDGRLVKIDDDVEFIYPRGDRRAPWRIQTRNSRRVDLTFIPKADRCERMNLGILRGSLEQRYGYFEGRLELDGGEVLPVDSLFGVTEEHQACW
jgi:hypothetical protein